MKLGSIVSLSWSNNSVLTVQQVQDGGAAVLSPSALSFVKALLGSRGNTQVSIPPFFNLWYNLHVEIVSQKELQLAIT